ncbi:chemotaxis protein CheW [Thermoanaerobacterium thermosaccharolyticum]|uniref:chemotaxis protein CheW n=1 Tax=Thermoanaerobacterium thermosaccharolyticum TaxID=1517 RepID=UPI0020A5DCC4|nr:chemotaxis protein CheW [Thermoanaerobacterium thermosaccharolyticum]MCP2238989.1 purine-binding chemotaxis protein CheW [Thermoanaerobacterium thermosaccharolyticum]
MELINTKDISKKDGRQYIIFYLGNEMFGIDMLYLQEIMRIPDVVKVPCTPAYIRGITNLRGTILTIVDCRLRLGLEKSDDTESSRVIVLTAEHKKLGYVVDQLVGVISFNEDELDKGSTSETAADFVDGVVKIENSQKLVMLLDAKKLLNLHNEESLKEDAEINKNNNHDIFSEREEENTDTNEEQLQMISFKIGKEEYGIEVSDVQEIVRFSSDVHEVPNTPPYILGIISLRNKVLPIVSLRRLFDMEECALDERSRIVVTKIEENDFSYLVGFRVDLVLEVLRIDKNAVLPVPPLLNTKDSEEISGICKLDEGSRLVYILDPKKLFKNRLRENVDILRTHVDDQEINVIDAKDEDEQLVSFLVDGIECAFPIVDVKEIMSSTEIMVVPKAPDFVEGIINLRGVIVPVIDLRKRFGLKEKNLDDYNRIVLVDISGRYTGLIVDSVKEVLKVGRSQIDSTPEILVDEIDQRFIEGIVKFDSSDRMVILLSVEDILSGKEKKELMSIDKANN